MTENSIKLVSLLNNPLTVIRLNEMYKKTDLGEYHLRYQKNILIILTLGGSAVIALWQIFDKFYFDALTSNLPLLRVSTIAMFGLNLIIALFRNKTEAYKQHLVTGFYIGTVFCLSLTISTGASTSPYWFGMFFIIVAWFVMAPYRFIEIVSHGFAFLSIFIIGIFLQREHELVNYEMAKMVFVYSGILIVSSFAAFIRNKLDIENYLIKQELKTKNEELCAVNEELKSEIENHNDTNQTLIEKQLFLDKILSNAPIVIWSIDLLGNFTFSQYKGNSVDNPGERIGKSALEIYKGTEVEAFIRKVLRDEVRSDILQVDSIYYDTRVSPMFNNNNEKIGYMGVSMDITELVISERTLKKFRLVLDQAPVAVFIMDKDSNFEYINPQFNKLSGYTEDELLHKNIVDTLYKGKIPDSRKGVVAGITSDKVWQGELLTFNKNGNTYWANTIAAPFYNENRKPDGYIVIQQDITERRKNEEELRLTKEKLQLLNQNLEEQVNQTVQQLTEVNTQLLRLQKENLQSQFEVLRQQVNPHFLFNSLNVLTSLIKIEPDLAEKFTEHLSKVYRYVLENKDNELVRLQTELDFIEAYIFLLNIRFTEKILVSINIDNNKKDMLLIPLAMQLLIENAIKHNSMSKKAPLKIDIFIDNENTLNIVNNLQERESHMASTGVGLKNIEYRYKLLEMPAPRFFKTETQFFAQIPLKANQD